MTLARHISSRTNTDFSENSARLARELATPAISGPIGQLAAAKRRVPLQPIRFKDAAAGAPRPTGTQSDATGPDRLQ